MSLGNYQFHYSFSGNPDKELILFLHGFMGNCHEFDETIKLLSDDFYCVTIDLPGHGKTQLFGGDECYTMVNTAQALINLLDKLKIYQCFLVGYSMGGRLALYLNLYFSQRFPKVILESASPGLIKEAERLERVKSDEQIARKLTRCVEESDFRAFLLNWYNQPIFGYIKNHPKFECMIESRSQNNPLELAKSLRFMGTGCQPCLWDQLEENINPLLLLAGEYDVKFITVNKKMVNACKVAQLQIIRNSGHNIHFENTFSFVQNIRKFLI
jgi:2-succinyl-6-hydroxy-2,4-cyclohexadiene-1-carboxylate synthase